MSFFTNVFIFAIFSSLSFFFLARLEGNQTVSSDPWIEERRVKIK